MTVSGFKLTDVLILNTDVPVVRSDTIYWTSQLGSNSTINRQTICATLY